MESQISIAIRDVSRFRPLKGQSTRLDVFFDCARQLLRNYVISPFWAVVSFLAGLPLVKAIDLPASDNGDEFSNNLFSDLAPLLTLFGEQVSKQFLSQSLGWADNIIFAMCPLGIITAVVAAIRVGGPRWLRALIGRARESRGAAEVELMSSTSDEVCELWRKE